MGYEGDDEGIVELFQDIRYVGDWAAGEEPEFLGAGRFLPSEVFYGETGVMG